MERPLVSIVTPLFNSEKFVADTIDSVVSQSYSNWEMIIVDDCSSDGSVEIVLGYKEKEERIRFFQLNENSGSGIARNKAIEESKGRYIAFLDSDDIWTPDKLEKHIKYMQTVGAVFSHTSYGYLNEEGSRIKGTFRVSKHPVSYHDLLKRTEISCLTAIYDAEKLGKFYMSKHKRKQDYALWLSILKTGVKSYPLDLELAFYRQSRNSATSNKPKLLVKHVSFLKETQRMNSLQALYYTAYWLINGIIRYYLK